MYTLPDALVRAILILGRLNDWNLSPLSRSRAIAIRSDSSWVYSPSLQAQRCAARRARDGEYSVNGRSGKVSATRVGPARGTRPPRGRAYGGGRAATRERQVPGTFI